MVSAITSTPAITNSSGGMARLGAGWGGRGGAARAGADLPPQDVDDQGRQHKVERGEGEEGHHQPRHRRHRVGGAQHVVDDPRLAAHLGDHPAASMAKNPSGPQTTMAHSISLLSGRRRWRQARNKASRLTPIMAKPQPTIRSKAGCTICVGGHWSRGKSSRPVTVAFGSWKARMLRPYGVSIA